MFKFRIYRIINYLIILLVCVSLKPAEWQFHVCVFGLHDFCLHVFIANHGSFMCASAEIVWNSSSEIMVSRFILTVRLQPVLYVC